MCRGWSGDDPQTDEACAVRTKVSTLLWKRDTVSANTVSPVESVVAEMHKGFIVLVRNGSDLGKFPRTPAHGGATTGAMRKMRKSRPQGDIPA